MWGGSAFEMADSIKVGTKIAGTVKLASITPKESAFSARSVLQEHIYQFSTDSNESIGQVREWHLRTERDAARIKGKYTRLDPASYSERDIERIFADYE